MGRDGRIGMGWGRMLRDEAERDGIGRDGTRRNELIRDEMKRDGMYMMIRN